MISGFALAALYFGGCADPIDTSRDPLPPPAAATLAADLRGLLKEKEPSYHRLLCKATHMVQKAALGREWPAVSRQLSAQGLRPAAENSWQYGTWHEYAIAQKAYTTKGGQSMDLFVYFSIWRETSKTARTREIVQQAYAGFNADVQTPYVQVLSESRFGAGTAIHKALLHEKVKEAAKKHPFLNAVEVYYDVIRDRWVELNSWGFFVRPKLIKGKGDASASAHVSVSIPSGLDPPVAHGSPVLVKDFVPRDTLGDVSYHGGMFTGSDDSKDGKPASVFLTRKGAPRWRETGQKQPEPVVAYGLGDLTALPAKTPAIRLENREVRDNDLAGLARFTNLQVLDLVTCDDITDRGLRRLAGLKSLRSLTLSGEQLSGTGFRRLQELPALTNLTVYSCEHLTDRGIAALSEMKHLTELSLLSAEALTDSQLADLAKLTALRKLNLWGGGGITDAGLTHLSMLPNLEELSFSKSRSVTPRGIACLVRLTSLRDISMGDMPLGDDAMPPRSRIKSLEYVLMNRLEITDQGIQSLCNLTQLKRLCLIDCKGVTMEGVNRLKANLKGDFELETH
jgi:hypothetical protein